MPRSASLIPPTAFWTLPFTWSALPSASVLLSPVTLPATSFHFALGRLSRAFDTIFIHVYRLCRITSATRSKVRCAGITGFRVAARDHFDRVARSRRCRLPICHHWEPLLEEPRNGSTTTLRRSRRWQCRNGLGPEQRCAPAPMLVAVRVAGRSQALGPFDAPERPSLQQHPFRQPQENDVSTYVGPNGHLYRRASHTGKWIAATIMSLR